MSDFLKALYIEVLPLLLQLIAVVVGLVLARVAAVAKDRWGIEIEARHREALHSAIMTGAAAALARGLRGEAAVQSAIDHALGRGSPDAIDYFGLAADDLKVLAQSKLQAAYPLMLLSGQQTAAGEVQA